ncbi:MAG: orotate phosphoribosyltransferase [Candidatus Eisenbacteria bacterium]|uniref:Orotate phosphoribosyltransferase n=1 Tax=Eiseniibacteriota bacterium TaxID=2212470 RepID=A0A948RYG2_UNCEI|nr:orotate phosphoribosyltransferase [Candidatus Eisenbacteria bacterium]MBU1950196.1 orotate phosphoribosyltransferase [Candidatus Eisenbacteria bacterium]MBU2691407.1 orotate phosphoribosyltransferase [Candidatus Eisenbacteria bacterium]
MDEARASLLDVIRRQSLKTGRFILASGAESNYYVDLRRTTTHPAGAYYATFLLLDLMKRWKPDAAGGPTLGADPLAGSMALLSHQLGHPLRTFMVRSKAKDHGTGRAVEGNLESGDRVVVLDDVVTSGGSLIKVLEPIREAGAVIVGATAILDREQGAAQALADAGLPFAPLFRISDLLDPEWIKGV